MKPYKSEKAQTILPLVDGFSMPKALVTMAMLDQAIGVGVFARNLLHTGSGAVIALATIEPAGGDWWKTVSLSNLAVSRNMIPASSSVDLEFEAYLSGTGRTFIKPIRPASDGTDGELRPEYILLDTPVRMRCQIWGQKAECNLAEKDAEVALATTKGRAIVVWCANPRESFPALPRPTLKQ
jgi:hypothetical protein